MSRPHPVGLPHNGSALSLLCRRTLGRCAVVGPILHEQPALLEQIAALVGGMRSAARQTLDYAYHIIGDMAVVDIGVANVRAVLKPIWAAKPETASRLRGRVEAIIKAHIVEAAEPHVAGLAVEREAIDPAAAPVRSDREIEPQTIQVHARQFLAQVHGTATIDLARHHPPRDSDRWWATRTDVGGAECAIKPGPSSRRPILADSIRTDPASVS